MEVFKPSIEQIKAVYAKKGYKFFGTGDYNLNIYGIRQDDIFDNTFSDTLGIIYPLNGDLCNIQIPGTTCPGLYGKGAVLDPIAGGVAVLVPGQYPGVWKFQDDYTTWLNYPFMWQVGYFKMWRDNNKDTIVDHVGEQNRADTGINMHRMSPIGVVTERVDSWSEGCQGSIEPEFKKFLPIFRESVKRYPNSFTYTLLEKKDFV